MYEGMNWINFTWSRDMLRALVNVVMNVQVELTDQLSNC